MARPSTPSYRPGTGVGSGQRIGSATGGAGINRPSQPIYRPGNSGSIIHGGSVTTPGGSTIGAIRGPRGGGAVGVVGPGGGAAAAVRGPRGGAAAGIRGPYGGAAGAVRGPGGTGIAAARGPLGNRYVTNLPGGSIHYPWHGNDYWCAGFAWYSPYWVGDSMYYGWTYPPEGYYYPSLPDESETVVIDNSTYYVSDGVYYQEGQQDGKPGYVVAAIPESEKAAADAAAEQENPYKYLKTMCDYITGLAAFGFSAQCTYDQMGEGGEKIQVSERRTLSFNRPGKVAVDVSSDTGKRRAVYDGKVVSMLDMKKNVYTSVPMPETADAALDKLADEYGIVVPMEDLLYKDLYDRMVSRAAQGRYVGQTKIGDHACHHLAFTTDSSTWEIWVDAGDQPILRKISIDYGIDTERFRYSAEVLKWDANPTFSAETFEFKLPADVKRFELTPVAKGK